MSFQWIVDNAESISINRMKVVGSTTARDGTYRSVSRGAQTWEFEVRLPDGPRWTDIRSYISQAEALDRITAANIQFNNSGHDWLIRYQGDLESTASLECTIPSSGNQITLTAGHTGLTTGQFIFRAGDIIQLGTGSCYTVAADVAYNQTSVILHRPLIDSADTGVSVKVGSACVWSVYCKQFPTWTLFARDQVSWSGPFIFTENLT